MKLETCVCAGLPCFKIGRFYESRVELAVAKFRHGVQAVAFGTGPFVVAARARERESWFPLKMGIRFLASTLHAHFRIALLFLFPLVSRFIRLDPSAMDLVAALPMVVTVSSFIRITLVSSGRALELWPSALLLFMDYFAFGFSSWWFVLQFGRDPLVHTWLAWCVIAVSYYNFVLVMFFVILRRFSGE